MGNLPLGTDVAALKDYFSCEARDQIESVFLISRSNCAFVNYRTQTACDEAMARFHGTNFNGARLVCRLRPRKASTTSTSSGAEGSAAAAAAAPPTDVSQASGEEGVTGSVEAPESATTATGEAQTTPTRPMAPPPPLRIRYFVLKSLTIQDLESSVRNRVWATQSHNEAVLNEAFEVRGTLLPQPASVKARC